MADYCQTGWWQVLKSLKLNIVIVRLGYSKGVVATYLFCFRCDALYQQTRFPGGAQVHRRHCLPRCGFLGLIRREQFLHGGSISQVSTCPRVGIPVKAVAALWYILIAFKLFINLNLFQVLYLKLVASGPGFWPGWISMGRSLRSLACNRSPVNYITINIM